MWISGIFDNQDPWQIDPIGSDLENSWKVITDFEIVYLEQRLCDGSAAIEPS